MSFSYQVYVMQTPEVRLPDSRSRDLLKFLLSGSGFNEPLEAYVIRPKYHDEGLTKTVKQYLDHGFSMYSRPTIFIADSSTHTCRETLLGSIKQLTSVNRHITNSIFSLDGATIEVVYNINLGAGYNQKHGEVIKRFYDAFPAVFTHNMSPIRTFSIETDNPNDVAFGFRIFSGHDFRLYLLSAVLNIVREESVMSILMEVGKSLGSESIRGANEIFRLWAKEFLFNYELWKIFGSHTCVKYAMFFYALGYGIHMGDYANGPVNLMDVGLTPAVLSSFILHMGLADEDGYSKFMKNIEQCGGEKGLYRYEQGFLKLLSIINK